MIGVGTQVIPLLAVFHIQKAECIAHHHGESYGMDCLGELRASLLRGVRFSLLGVCFQRQFLPFLPGTEMDGHVKLLDSCGAALERYGYRVCFLRPMVLMWFSM